MTEEGKILLSERNGESGKEYFYVQPENQEVIKGISLNFTVKDNIKNGFKNIFKEIFLPQGYPFSVSEDYISYQIWDTAQAFCSTITGILATQSVMKGVGVGDNEATPLAATITWVLKDGTGHIGRIGFAWWKGTSLDANSKKWRLVADVLNDMAICLELILPIFEGYTTYVLCLTTAMKAIVGVAGGATRAALTQHQAVRGNLADVSAKDGSQETAVNLCASMVAILILTLIQKNLWIVFLIFTALHLISNYLAVSSVCLKSFNCERLMILLKHYFKDNKFLSPEIVNKKESVIFGLSMTDKDLCGCDILIGNSIKELISSNRITLDEIKNDLKIYMNSNYMLLVDIKKEFISIVYNKEVTPKEVIKSYYHANKLAHRLIHFSKYNSSICECMKKKYIDFECKNCQKYYVYIDIKKSVDSEWPNVAKNLEIAGWRLENQLILYNEWRAKWGT